MVYSTHLVSQWVTSAYSTFQRKYIKEARNSFRFIYPSIYCTHLWTHSSTKRLLWRPREGAEFVQATTLLIRGSDDSFEWGIAKNEGRKNETDSNNFIFPSDVTNDNGLLALKAERWRSWILFEWSTKRSRFGAFNSFAFCESLSSENEKTGTWKRRIKSQKRNVY